MVELAESRRILEENLGRPVLAFAYPNGHRPDITDEVVKLASQSGYQCAFTLQPGPTRYSTVRKNPFLIRRVFISAKDNLNSFAAKLAGLPRLPYALRGSPSQTHY
jgi:peptidoglycan/xylan/chitin deacetylase (PgdA/CDA1 family)